MTADSSTFQRIAKLADEQPVLVTGCAGFIGFHLARKLLDSGIDVLGLDNLNDYYDVSLKQARLNLLKDGRFDFRRVDISDASAVNEIFAVSRPRLVIHLAAQPGVRYSLINPGAYGQSNLVATLNILEACRQSKIRHLVFASSSSVYGANTKQPFAVEDNVDQPVSLYAATKKSCELMAHAYSHLYQLPVTGLRFFTVYGPWGRPDMAYFSFARSILSGEPINVFNNGAMSRDFTFIDDIINGMVQVCSRPAGQSGDGIAPYRLYNIGNGKPESLGRMIEILEQQLGRTAERKMLPMQPGDVVSTFADTSALERDFGFRPSTTLELGLEKFVDWYRQYYGEST